MTNYQDFLLDTKRFKYLTSYLYFNYRISISSLANNLVISRMEIIGNNIVIDFLYKLYEKW